MKKFSKISLIFPGQGTQYPGMAKDFIENFTESKLLFEEADDLLKRKISKIVLEGPEKVLTETQNSQVAIFLASFAMLKVLQKLIPDLQFSFAAGLSLGEYTALTAAKVLPFQIALQLVEKRGKFMNEACEKTSGSMAVIMGLDAEQVEEMISEANLPQDLWAANFNCPGQVVISGTVKGIAEGTKRAKDLGAKRVLPLEVHGAFHSGLMQEAEDKLKEELSFILFQKTETKIAMNVPGDLISNPEEMKKALGKQVTHPVRWEQCIRSISREGSDLFIEIGPGRTLAGMNKRIGILAPTFNLEKVSDLDFLAKELEA